jgi:hypothetical protein
MHTTHVSGRTCSSKADKQIYRFTEVCVCVCICLSACPSSLRDDTFCCAVMLGGNCYATDPHVFIVPRLLFCIRTAAGHSVVMFVREVPAASDSRLTMHCLVLASGLIVPKPSFVNTSSSVCFLRVRTSVVTESVLGLGSGHVPRDVPACPGAKQTAVRKRSQNFLPSWPVREPRLLSYRLALQLCIREAQGSRLS